MSTTGALFTFAYRKSVERLKIDVPEKKEFEIVPVGGTTAIRINIYQFHLTGSLKGNGAKLETLAKVLKALDAIKVDDLVDVHRLLYGTPGAVGNLPLSP
jgi:hypothetical protein